MFVDHYSTVPPELLALRSVVLEKKKVHAFPMNLDPLLLGLPDAMFLMFV